MPAISASGVTKRYGDVTALQNLDLTVREGEVFGFLGPNGAGKTTAIDILLDFVKPTGGTVEVFGIDCQADPVGVRRHVGVLPEGHGVLGRMTGREQIDFAIESKGVTDDPEDLLDLVGLGPVADRQARAYSKGMRQRLGLAVAMVGDPDLLILDEPTTGLDPNSARSVRNVVATLSDDGTAVFFSSHSLDQVEAVADRVGILREGRLVAVDSIDGLREAAGTRGELSVRLAAEPSAETLDHVRTLDGVAEVTVDGATVTANCDDGAKAAVIDAVRADGATVENLTTSEASLEDVFAHYT